MLQEPAGRHEIQIFGWIGWARLVRTVLRITIGVLRPQSVHHKTTTAFLALFRTGVPWRVAKFRFPGKIQQIVVKYAGLTTLPRLRWMVMGTRERRDR